MLSLPAQAVTLAGPARVIDGDTLDVSGARVRLAGIDAPELSQTCQRGGRGWACGDWARNEMRQRTSGRHVACEGDARDRYGRWLATCTVGGIDLGRSLVRDGVAFAYRRYSTAYVPEEDAAAGARRGLWAGTATLPELYRKTGGDVRQGCAIKGNLSARGRIYHSPGEPGYAATRIDTRRGERWFCTAAEARSAGWRAAAR